MHAYSAKYTQSQFIVYVYFFYREAHTHTSSRIEIDDSNVVSGAKRSA